MTPGSRFLGLLPALALAIAACGSSSATAPSAASSPAAPAISPAASSKPSPAASSAPLGAEKPSARLAGGDPSGYPIRVSYPSPAVSALYYYAALGQGFFAQQHLNVTMIQMAQSVVIPAETNGEIEFNDTAPAAIEGATRGLPLRAILATWSRAPWTVYGKASSSHCRTSKAKTSEPTRWAAGPTCT